MSRLRVLFIFIFALALTGCIQTQNQQQEQQQELTTPTPAVRTPPGKFSSDSGGYLWYNLSFTPKPGEHLYSRGKRTLHDCVLDDRESKLILVDSHAELGVVRANQTTGPPVCPIKAEVGDTCVVIKGTIRNEYDRGYTVGVYGDVFNSTGAEVGHIIDPPVCRFTTTYAEANGTGNFSLHVKYDKQDISHYHLYAFTCNQPLP
ncbi:MAG: hypothetical protein R6U44_03180 [Archaeoglobaceae archaeon]